MAIWFSLTMTMPIIVWEAKLSIIQSTNMALEPGTERVLGQSVHPDFRSYQAQYSLSGVFM